MVLGHLLTFSCARSVLISSARHVHETREAAKQSADASGCGQWFACNVTKQHVMRHDATGCMLLVCIDASVQAIAWPGRVLVCVC